MEKDSAYMFMGRTRQSNEVFVLSLRRKRSYMSCTFREVWQRFLKRPTVADKWCLRHVPSSVATAERC
jgi:hypothetical protein